MRTRSMLLPAGLTALALGLLVPAARAGDLLDEAKAKQAVEAQRMEKMVRENRAEAERLFKVRPPTRWPCSRARWHRWKPTGRWTGKARHGDSPGRA